MNSSKSEIFNIDMYTSEIRRKLGNLTEKDQSYIKDLLYILPDLGFFEADAVILEIDHTIKE